MNSIEKVMTKRSTEFKLGVAVAVLVILLVMMFSSIGSLWLIPLTVVVLWIALQQALRYRHHRGS
jgi:hypothetical protein